MFVGGKEIGKYCLEQIIAHQSDGFYRIIGIVPNESNALASLDSIESLAAEHSIPVYSGFDDIPERHFDFLVSVQFDKILKPSQISRCSGLAINLHMAPLPEYRGCNQFSFAILDEVALFGTSIHLLESGIDSGDILFEKRFAIEKNLFVYELYDLTLAASKQLFLESWPKLLKADFIPKSQAKYTDRAKGFHLRKEIVSIKKIQEEWPIEKQLKHFRATYFPPFPPPALFKNDTFVKDLDMNWYLDNLQ